MVSRFVFIALLIVGSTLFYINFTRIIRNIKLGKKLIINDNRGLRLKNLFMVAIGQSKMVKRPIAGILHIFVYVGFIIVNIELLEIIYDGVSGTHRILSFLPFYNALISILEYLAVFVILACIFFLIRRNILRIQRFWLVELKGWPRLDANIILTTEIFILMAFLIMNAADTLLQNSGLNEQAHFGPFTVSSYLQPVMSQFDVNQLSLIERFSWWFHIIGIFAFLNYLPYSKHFHIIMAFPNVYYSKLKPLAYISNMESITREVRIAMGLDSDVNSSSTEQGTFGAKDIRDLTWKTLMDAYSCTECGRCTAVCPANLTGKKLSPRKIVMDTRDRMEEIGNGLIKNGEKFSDDKLLLYNYISTEEIWACTTCNACSFECPVNIDPLSIIIELRRYVFMEKAAAPSTVNAMSVNIENNGAPWQYSQADRANWAL